MRKKHNYEALLKYMRMLEDGYSIDHIHRKFGISGEQLKCMWLLYQQHGTSVLRRKQYTQVSGELKQQIVRDIEKKSLNFGASLVKIRSKCSKIECLAKDI